MNSNQTMTLFAEQVLTWYDAYGRKDLPWQNTIDPYKIWVSEIMLQQTQVLTVIPYYQKFLKRFPTIKTLADANQDDVLHYWTGLGYYARARNLHKAAQTIVNEYKGLFPTDFDSVIALPGIGKSTAGAILSFSQNQHHAILDGNVKRVLCRYFGVQGWPSKASVEKELWKFAEENTPNTRTNHYTQAVMDFGANQCSRSKPNCAQCPLKTHCFAYANQLTSQLPNKKPKKPIPVRKSLFLIIENQQQEKLLLQRPPTGIWGGLWCFPEIPFDKKQPSNSEVAIEIQQSYGLKLDKLTLGKTFRHTFSHFHLDITLVHANTNEQQSACISDSNSLWFEGKKHLQIGLAAPIKKILESITSLGE